MEVPNEKSQKYDRQLRLWGDHGQSLLESSKVCLIHATATGCEILKNLILPGIGSFTIIDDEIVSEQDLGNNFFLTTDSINQKRGQEVTKNLKELNDEVEGSFLDENAGNLLKRSPEVFLKFSVVIVTCLTQRLLLELDKYLSAHNIPLVLCQSYGMIGYLRIVTKDHTVIESHPEHPHPDLRLTEPFTELQKFCDSIDLATLDKKQHSHIPWLVIIYKYLQEYKSQHNGECPKTYKQKKDLKALIEKGIRCNEFGVPEQEENFEEAIKSVNTALTEAAVPSSLTNILNHPNTKNITSESKAFWIMTRALKEFVDTHGWLPLQGSIPDMTSDSETYIALQQIYRNKATEHVNEILDRINHIKQSFQVNELLVSEHQTSQPSEPTSIEDVRLFCRNAAHLSLSNCRSLTEEFNIKTANAQMIASRLDDESDDCVYYVLLRAAEEFYSEYSRYPGCDNDRVEADITLLKAIVNKMLHDINVNTTIREDFIHEMCSYGGAELHSVASYMGGVAAQEIIKITCRQYIPINNTYVYNACTQTSITLEL